MRSTPPSRRTSRPAPLLRRRGVVAILIALLLGATTSDLAHRAAVDHAVCDEHGEVIHAVATSPLAAAVAADLAERFDPGPRARPLEREGSLHEHCQLGPFLRERAAQLPRGFAGARPAPPPRRASPLPTLVAPARSQPLLLLAPKQSPPV